MSQPDLLVHNTMLVRRLFDQYDNGALSLSQFREQIRRLGLEETQDFRRLLRTASHGMTLVQVQNRNIPAYSTAGSTSVGSALDVTRQVRAPC